MMAGKKSTTIKPLTVTKRQRVRSGSVKEVFSEAAYEEEKRTAQSACISRQKSAVLFDAGHFTVKCQ